MSLADDLAMMVTGLLGLPADHPDLATTQAILHEAARFTEAYLKPGGKQADRIGARVVDGRVILPDCQRESWAAYVANGWNHLSVAEAYGGQALPLTIATAAQMLFDGADMGVGMLALNQRCAIRMLLKIAPIDLQNIWIPRIANGSWGTTICISEADAGTDVGRIRTRAEPADDGTYRITGQKCWISYGDHNLTEGVVHFILARTPGLPAGTKGLSLFLLPDTLEDGTRNGVSVLRIEEKLGLHASPTCVLAFEESRALPLSPPGRGLPALFEMIVGMRLGVGGQSCALALHAAAIAAGYAAERRQGGAPGDVATPIHHHAEVRRMLLGMQLATQGMTLLTLQAASWIDAGDRGDAAAAARGGVLLPVVKALASETAFNTASQAMQVLGGAGYTKEWPVERMLRDSRVFSIYEGTTAVQALDFTFRQWLGQGQTAADEVLDALAPAPMVRDALHHLRERIGASPRAAQEQAALPVLRLYGLACTDGLLRRYAAGEGALAARFGGLLAFHDMSLAARIDGFLAQAEAPDHDASFQAVFGHLMPANRQ